MDLVTRIINEINDSPLNRGMSGEEWLSEPRNMFLHSEGDLALFDYISPGQYAIHLFFESRGRDAIDRVKQFTKLMFDQYDAHMLYGYVPVFRRDVAYVAAQSGWHYVGIRQSNFGPVRVYLTAPETH